MYALSELNDRFSELYNLWNYLKTNLGITEYHLRKHDFTWKSHEHYDENYKISEFIH